VKNVVKRGVATHRLEYHRMLLGFIPGRRIVGGGYLRQRNAAQGRLTADRLVLQFANATTPRISMATALDEDLVPSLVPTWHREGS
jgi:hypothetical protein